MRSSSHDASSYFTAIVLLEVMLVCLPICLIALNLILSSYFKCAFLKDKNCNIINITYAAPPAAIKTHLFYPLLIFFPH